MRRGHFSDVYIQVVISCGVVRVGILLLVNIGVVEWPNGMVCVNHNEGMEVYLYNSILFHY